MKIDISAKLSFVLFIWLCGFLLNWTINIWILPFLLIARYTLSAFSPVSERSRKAFNKFLLYGFTLALLLLLINGLLLRGGDLILRIAGFHLYEEGILFGASTATRLLVLSISLLLFFLSTPLNEFVGYLQKTGLPPQLVLILLLTLHFIDQLPLRIQRIYRAQEARGAPVRARLWSRVKAFFSILSPLILSSIVESIDRGLALELRGFRHDIPFSSAQMEQPNQRASMLAIVLFAFSLLLLFYAVVQWLSI